MNSNIFLKEVFSTSLYVCTVCVHVSQCTVCLSDERIQIPNKFIIDYSHIRGLGSVIRSR